MADIKEVLGSSTALAITLASLADGAARESDAVDNGTNLFIDALVQVSIALQIGSPDEAVYVYAYGSEDGVVFTDNATGSDAAVTLRDPTNLTLIGVISTPTSGGLTYVSAPMSVAAAFGGRLPRKWGIVVENQSGVAFSATEGDHAYTYSGVYYQQS